MSLMLYPNKAEPQGYRLVDKVLSEQLYFPVKRYGSWDKAKAAAEKEESKLMQRRNLRELRLELGINQLFYPDGSVIGLRKGTRLIHGRLVNMLIAQITVNGKQIKTDRKLNNRTFRDAYISIQDWILQKRGIQRTLEITKQFKECEYLYRF